MFVLVSLPGLAAETFKDVPKDHWAAESVQKLADAGIVTGYPDRTFRGDKPITRYELAAALEKFVEFVQQSRKPLKKEPVKPSSQADWKRDSMASLKAGEFLPSDSKLLKDGEKTVTPEDLADALASVAKRLIEVSVPEPKTDGQNSNSP